MNKLFIFFVLSFIFSTNSVMATSNLILNELRGMTISCHSYIDNTARMDWSTITFENDGTISGTFDRGTIFLDAPVENIDSFENKIILTTGKSMTSEFFQKKYRARIILVASEETLLDSFILEIKEGFKWVRKMSCESKILRQCGWGWKEL